MVRSAWAKMWILLMMTHLPVLGRCVRCHLLSEAMLGPTDIGGPFCLTALAHI